MQKYTSKIWCLGFLGFLSLQYLASKDLSDLWFIAFFGMFAYYFIYKIGASVADERLLENSNKAKSMILPIPLVSVFLIGFALSMDVISQEGTVLLLALTFAGTLIAYAYAFYHIDKR